MYESSLHRRCDFSMTRKWNDIIPCAKLLLGELDKVVETMMTFPGGPCVINTALDWIPARQVPYLIYWPWSFSNIFFDHPGYYFLHPNSNNLPICWKCDLLHALKSSPSEAILILQYLPITHYPAYSTTSDQPTAPNLANPWDPDVLIATYLLAMYQFAIKFIPFLKLFHSQNDLHLSRSSFHFHNPQVLKSRPQTSLKRNTIGYLFLTVTQP